MHAFQWRARAAALGGGAPSRALMAARLARLEPERRARTSSKRAQRQLQNSVRKP